MPAHAALIDPGAKSDPAAYDAWYQTDWGRWIGGLELQLLNRLLKPRSGDTVLDIGCGTGYFTRRFADLGLDVTGLDPDLDALRFAHSRRPANFIAGDAQQLPFADRSFDHCVAITSLCFVDEPARAVAEMARVARKGMVLGLLHRNSLLYRRKAGRGAYHGARWDRCSEARRWFSVLPGLGPVVCRWAVFDPSASPAARIIEQLLPASIPLGGFLAVATHWGGASKA